MLGKFVEILQGTRLVHFFIINLTCFFTIFIVWGNLLEGLPGTMPLVQLALALVQVRASGTAQLLHKSRTADREKIWHVMAYGKKKYI